MENDLIKKAQAIADNLAEEARKKGLGSEFIVETVSGGMRDGEVHIRKEKPDGEVVIYPVNNS